MTRDPNAATRAELREMNERATPTPWEAVLIDDPRGQPSVMYRSLIAVWEYNSSRYMSLVGPEDEEIAAPEHIANLKFVVAMRNALPALLDEIDAAQRFIGHLGPICWKCQVLEERGFCLCEIAANE